MDLSEPSWKRAYKDTVAAQRSLIFMWVGQAVLATAGGAWLIAIAPTTASVAEQVGRAVGGGLAGLFTAVVIMLVFNFFRAPYQQRNEAREIVFNRSKLGLGIKVRRAELLKVNPWGPGYGPDKPILRVEAEVTFYPVNPPLQLAKLQLCCGNKRIDAPLPTHLVERVEIYTVVFEGQYADIAPARRDLNEYWGRIYALAGGHDWYSEEFLFAGPVMQ